MNDLAMTPGLWLLQADVTANPLVPVVLMIVVFYFVLFMPMRRRQKKHDEMLQNLKSGDRVATSGGIIGTITALGEQVVTLRVRPDNLKLELERSAIRGLVEEETAEK